MVAFEACSKMKKRRHRGIVAERLGIAVAVACGVAYEVGVSPAPAPGHSFLHINCPPGSHGQRMQAGYGRTVEASRDERLQRWTTLQNRRFTAGHPASP